MRPCSLQWLVLMCSCFPLTARGDDIAKAKERVQGTWVVVNHETLGAPVAHQVFDGMTVTFKGDSVTFKAKKEIPFTYTLEVTKEPWILDMTRTDEKGKEVTCRGIYKFDVDGFLILCSNSAGSKHRPKEFQTGREPELASFSIYVLKLANP